MSKYYSIQGIELWEERKNKKYFKNNDKFICHESFRNAYEWIKGELKRKAGVKNVDNSMIWLWTEKPNIKTLSQDCHLNEGEKGVLLEIEINDSLVLKSDFELWHYVLMDIPISNNDFESECLKVASWQKIFKINKDSLVQGVTSKLKTKDIKVICEFTGKKNNI